MKHCKRPTGFPFLRAAAAALLVTVAGAAGAAEFEMREAQSLDELLQLMKERQLFENAENDRRLREFRQARDRQQNLLQQARAEREAEEQRSERLETQFEENERRIAALQEQLDENLGSLRELFGVLQQVAGDTRGLFEGSIISAQPNITGPEGGSRADWLDEFAAKMGSSTQLASIEEMETLVNMIVEEMTATGQVARFQAEVVTASEGNVVKDVIRIGAFNLVADGEYLLYEDGLIEELPRQPSARFTSTLDNLAAAEPGELVRTAVDPTRGSLIYLLTTQAKTLSDRIGTFTGGLSTDGCHLPFSDGDGGCIGAIIILVGFIGVLLAIERLISLTLMSMSVSAQKKSDTVKTNNPLGRVLKVYEDNKNVDVETLELKLGEAILQETPRISRNLTLIQVISAVAPLMGLLGTVVGMILTFQAITLFGTGDPKTMAGGISTALMTTVLGLVVAIPTVLAHAIVSMFSKSVIHVLEEQSAGIVAERAEKSGQPLG